MTAQRSIAIFPWGPVIEDFLDPLGLEPADFARRMSGGWLFGFVAALQRQDRPCVIVYASARTQTPQRLIHAETGAPIWLVPGRRSGGGASRNSPALRAAQEWRRTPWRRFRDVLGAENCGAVLVQDYETPRFDALALLSRSVDLPLYATFQGGDQTLSAAEAAVRRTTLAACRGLIVASARERQRLRSRYGLPETRLHDIPNPLDAEAWRAEPRQQARRDLGLPRDGFLAVWHGRIDIRRKGLDVLLDAWRRVRAQCAQAQLVLIGSGQDHAAFAPLAAQAAGVTWLSEYRTDRPLIRRWLSAADAYVAPSRTEGLPVAPLEAMACSLPVVASDAHGLADIFADGPEAGGLQVRREDPVATAEALLRLAADPALRQGLGAAARRRVESRFSLDAVGAQLAEHLVVRADPGDAPRPRPARTGPCPG